MDMVMGYLLLENMNSPQWHHNLVAHCQLLAHSASVSIFRNKYEVCYVVSLLLVKHFIFWMKMIWTYLVGTRYLSLYLVSKAQYNTYFIYRKLLCFINLGIFLKVSTLETFRFLFVYFFILLIFLAALMLLRILHPSAANLSFLLIIVGFLSKWERKKEKLNLS